MRAIRRDGQTGTPGDGGAPELDDEGGDTMSARRFHRMQQREEVPMTTAMRRWGTRAAVAGHAARPEDVPR